MLKIQKTKKKFYNKWLYKTSLKIDGASVFRSYTFDQIKNVLDDAGPTNRSYFLEKARKNKKDFSRIIDFLSSVPKETYNIRIESSILDIYSNDEKFNSAARNNLTDLVRSSFEPEEYLLNTNENDLILAAKYPKDMYKFRVYVLPHKIKDQEEKSRYLNWIQTQSGISMSEKVKEWFLNCNYNWDRRYILAKEESDLLMLKMRNSDVVGKILRYKLLDK